MDKIITEVMPGLFMGGDAPTKNEALLRSCKITHVLSVGQRPLKMFSGITYTFVEAVDVPQFPIRDILPECISVIDRERKGGGSVYVHCKEGVSRSAAVVIAYLKVKENLTYEQAFDKLKEIRDCINPNYGFVNQLKEF